MFLFSDDCEKRKVVTLTGVTDGTLSPGEDDYISTSLGVVGISDVRKYAVISVQQGTSLDGDTITSGGEVASQIGFPYVQVHGESNTMDICVINATDSPSAIWARVVLMQIA